MLLEGKVAIVTGASRGIGKAIAEVFAREGAVVAICGRKQETLDRVAESCRDLPGRIVAIACHVGRPEELTRLVDTVMAAYGRVDVLVNNAATNVAQGFCLGIDDSQFDKMIEVNLKSAFRLTRLVAPGMSARGSGSIINVASVAGLRPQQEGLMYSTTKAALIMMTRCFALELGPAGVRVNAIAPGLIQTQLSEYYWGDATRLAGYLGRQPIQRIGQPHEIAEAALLLASDRCSYVTGEVLVADGGYTIA
jgi:dehydrogenase/reductase SDR family protein 4